MRCIPATAAKWIYEMSQLPLNLRWAPEYDLDAFHFDEPAQRSFLQSVISKPTHQAVVLVGASGAGKSYLMRALAARVAGAQVIDAGAVRSPNAALFGIDNLTDAAGNSELEEWLFHDFNRALDRDVPWFACSQVVPALIPFQLADLRSRLMQATLVRLPLCHDARLEILKSQAAGMGCSIDEGVLNYLETHVSRDLAQLSQWLKRLNDYSLARGRRITVAAVRELIKLSDDSFAKADAQQ
jgi:DnaA-homolog protein